MNKMGYVMASKILVNNKLKILFMYREQPDNVNDSGWRFFTGGETQEYLDDPDNTGIYNISTIIAIDKDIEPYLRKPAGSAFERENADSDFVDAEFDFGSNLQD